MGEIVRFDGKFKRHTAQPAGSEVIEPARKWGQFADNQYSRRALLRMLLTGGTLRGVARKHPQGEAGLRQDIVDELLGGNRAA